MPKISVIVPIYNSSAYLVKCLDSLSKHTFKDFKVLMIDDGSTDSSMSICQKYVEKDPRFRFFHQKHQGPSQARNYGLTIMRGERLTFVDSDDFVEQDYLQALNNQMNEFGSEIATAPYYRFNVESKEYKFFTYNNMHIEDYEQAYSSTDWLLHRSLWQSVLGVSVDTAWGKLFKKSAFNNIWFPINRTYAEDSLTAWKLYRNVNTISFGRQANYCWQIRPNELSNNHQSSLEIPEAVLHATEEEIAALALAGKDVSSLKDQYIDCLRKIRKQSLAQTDFYRYHDATFKLRSLKNRRP